MTDVKPGDRVAMISGGSRGIGLEVARRLAREGFSLTITARDQQREEKAIEPSALSALINYNWPGNVRELQNAIERAFTLSGERIDHGHSRPMIR